MAPHKLTSHVIATEDGLREIIGQPTELVRAKLAGSLNPLTQQFIQHSPFVCIATRGADGSCDVSPRGDPRPFDASAYDEERAARYARRDGFY
jgi:hypothetical protein